MDNHQNKQRSLDQDNRLKIVFFLSLCYFSASLIIVIATDSLSLLSEAGHMLADVGGLALALFAINYTRKPPTPERTFGFFRLEILASLTNSVVLVILSIYILYEGFIRMFNPPLIQGFPIVITALIGLVINFIGVWLLKGRESESTVIVHSHGSNNQGNKNKKRKKDEQKRDEHEQNLNLRAVYLETLSDTIGAAGVLVAGLIILTTKFYIADSLISIGLAFFMIPRAWSIIKKAIHILIQGSPHTISHKEVKETILKIKGVTGVFDLHIWTITSGMHTLSAHVVVIDHNKSQEILQEINSILEKRFKITHATIQIERYHSESDF
ncbi:MAG TPA: cation diffusion facilitator family transporter [Candidatus Nitrosocosmicus sp.]